MRELDARWRIVGGLALFGALVLMASLLATSMARVDIAEDAEIQKLANEVLIGAWTADALLTQADLITEQANLGLVTRSDAQRAVDEVREAAIHFDQALARLRALSPRGDTIAALDAGPALAAAIDRLEQGSVIETTDASDQLQKAIALADGERLLKAGEIAASAKQAGRVAVAARWLVAVILPGMAILAIRWNQRRAAERMRFEAEIATERAVQESKTQFVNAVLHHLRTPMSAVLGFAETLRTERHRFNARQRNDMIETIADQATDLGYLMEDLRVASRPDDQLVPIDISDCDLRRSTETVLTGLEMQHADFVTVTGYADASADPKRLRQILRHLIGNAREHRRTHVAITIGTNDTTSWVEVSDDGPGLPSTDIGSDVKPETMSSGETAESLRVGLGLQLSVRLAQQMDGRLTYERRDGETVFRLVLPQAIGEDGPVVGARPEGVSTADLFALLESQDFEVVLQPIFDAGSSMTSILGFEALSRFRHGTPPDWLQAAERAGMIVDFELATIRKAVQDARHLAVDAYLALNVSTDTLLSSELLDACAGIDPSRVVFELSEDATVANYERTCAAVEQLTGRGYRLALDDVGTGEMDLWHVVRLSPQIIKLDMSLIEAIDDPDNLAIIESILAAAKRINAKVVAEGIETEPQLVWVRKLGIEAVPGILPRPADETLGSGFLRPHREMGRNRPRGGRSRRGECDRGRQVSGEPRLAQRPARLLEPMIRRARRDRASTRRSSEIHPRAW